MSNLLTDGISPTLLATTKLNLSRQQVLVGALAAAGVAGCTGADAAEPVTEVTFPGYEWSNPQDILFWRPFKEGFEKSNPDVKIRDIPVPYGNFWDKQFVELSASNSPDIVTMFDTEMKSYVEHDFVEPLNSYLEKAGVTLDDFQPGAQAAVKDGNIYGLLFLVNPRAMFYHGGLFRNEGLGVPKNLAEFYAALRKLRKRETQQWGFATYAKPGDPNNLFSEIMPIIAGFGGAFFEKGAPTATKPETVEALKFYKQIYDEDLIPRGLDINAYRQLFAEGKIAMYASGPFMSGLVRKASAERMAELGATALPFPGNRTFALSVFLGIGKTAEHKDAAARVLLAATSQRWQSEVLKIQGSPPGLRSIDYSNFVAANPWFKAFRDAANAPQMISFAPDGAETFGPDPILLRAARDDGHTEEIAPMGSADPILAVHDPEYVEFLRTLYQRWRATPDCGEYAVPDSHPTHRMRRKPTDLRGELGWYCNSTGCPVAADTWTAVNASAQVAVHGARRLIEGASSVYALCRPPGHHVYPDLMSGSCFLNNASIAAQLLTTRFEKVALVDIDVNHGNGSQHIFYSRSDVLFCSIHVDPSVAPPFYAGFADEVGEGSVKGATSTFHCREELVMRHGCWHSRLRCQRLSNLVRRRSLYPSDWMPASTIRTPSYAGLRTLRRGVKLGRQLCRSPSTLPPPDQASTVV